MAVECVLVSLMEEFLSIFLDNFLFRGFFGTEFHLCNLIDLVFDVLLGFHLVSRGLFRGFGRKIYVLLVLAFAFSLD